MTVQLCNKCWEQNREARGNVVYIPKGVPVDTRVVMSLARKHVPAREIAQKVGCTPRRIWQILSK